MDVGIINQCGSSDKSLSAKKVFLLSKIYPLLKVYSFIKNIFFIKSIFFIKAYSKWLFVLQVSQNSCYHGAVSDSHI